MNRITIMLKDIAKVVNGSTPSTKQSDFYNGDIIWITPKDLSNLKHRYIFKGEKNITKKGYESCSTTLIPKGTILLSSRAPIGLLAIAGVELCTNQGFKNIIPNSELIDNQYLYYYLKIKIEELNNLGSGTTFKELSKASIENFKLNIHKNLSTQKAIAKVLSDLDSKIELNNRINRELEAMAKTLYDYWFVQFDFPNEQGKPYKSSGGKMVYNKELKREIPEGWEVGTFNNVLSTIESGDRPKGGIKNIENGIPSIGAENILSIGKYNYGQEKLIPKEYFEKMSNGIIKSGDVVMYKDGASLGRVSMFKNDFPYKHCAINSHAFIIRTNDKISQNYIYFWLDQDYIKEIIRRLGMKAAQPGINQVNVKSIPIIIPNKETIELFDKTITNNIDLIFENAKQNKELSNLRDWLLPMLMNGQVTVQQAETKVKNLINETANMVAEPEVVYKKGKDAN